MHRKQIIQKSRLSATFNSLLSNWLYHAIPCSNGCEFFWLTCVSHISEVRTLCKYKAAKENFSEILVKLHPQWFIWFNNVRYSPRKQGPGKVFRQVAEKRVCKLEISLSIDPQIERTVLCPVLKQASTLFLLFCSTLLSARLPSVSRS